ncbi:MAG TPA: integrase arm-type DNA-binding domain-containing protein [Pseudolabrys sp.]|nr:integrase arm-type DNA-binding domain-containing protein [Pseudolabrys sp.]
MLHKLTQADLRRTTPGLYADGGNLYLQVTVNGDSVARSWIFRFAIDGKRREMGLGAVHTFGLKDARAKAAELRKLVYEGRDPIAERDAQRAALAAASAKRRTFDECVASYSRAHSPKWSAKHAYQWGSAMTRFASPVLGKLPVDIIDVSFVVRVLEPIWHERPEVASRLRGAIESVLAWATVRQFRSGDNPARWTNHLEELLPSRREILPVEHFAALAYRDVPGLIAKLRERSGIVGRALEFLILTASRSGEVLGARWDEIGLAERVWTVPAERMKSRREHRVPLCDRALAILNEMKLYRRNGFVFPSERRENLGESPMRELLKRLGYKATIHGMRSTFRDWAGEQTNFAREVCEAALAHAIGNKVEQTYRRGDALEKRRRLMEAWADFCSRPVAQGATITKLHVGNLG